ncbi:MAG: SIS domain-containing protein [Verrucomicrobia bacterium]|nr:SIS domain-containing protein [Verrucomicrobiota bacterium]
MFTTRFNELALCVKDCKYTFHEEMITEETAAQKAFQMISDVPRNKGVVYVIGNGGSAGIASHFSNDLMKALQIPSQTLYDSNLLTCLANDIGYENIFSYPLSKYLKSNDLLVAISSSGQSLNIVKGAEIAIRRRTPLITLTGFKSANPLRQMGNLNFWIDRSDYGLVETAHFFLLHTIIDTWEKLSQTVEHGQFAASIRTH